MTTSEPGTCRCGCLESTSARANYRPGHDSRHLAGAVQRLVLEAEEGRRVGARQIAAASKEMPSAALRAKFAERAARAVRALRQSERSAGSTKAAVRHLICDTGASQTACGLATVRQSPSQSTPWGTARGRDIAVWEDDPRPTDDNYDDCGPCWGGTGSESEEGRGTDAAGDR